MKKRYIIAVTIAVIVLGVIAAWSFLKWRNDAVRRSVAKEDIQQICSALKMYRLLTGQCPTTTQGLKALMQNPGVTNWQAFLDPKIPLDPWGTPYRYTTTTNGFEIRSAGPDKAFGTADDLTN